MFNDVNGGLPALVDYQHVAGGQSYDMLAPVEVNNAQMLARYLLQKAISVFRWELPATWNKDYFLYVLYCWGRVAVVNTDKFGVIPQACGLMGYDVFYQPTNAIISNSLLTGILQPRINRECVVLKLQPDYGGILDLVFYYANLMAQAATAAGVNLLNSKVATVFFAERKSTAEAFKKLYDSIANGQPMVVADKYLLNEDGSPAWQSFQRSVKESYILTDLLSDLRKLEAMYDTDIGIPNANTDKRERLITDEVNANNVETYSKCALWLEQLKDGCDRVRQMFGVEMSVDWRTFPQSAEMTDGTEGVDADGRED